MSNTRKAAPGAPFKQERFASSPEFQRGLMANLVARRCQLLDKPDDRALLWFIQYLSHQEGGLKNLSETILAQYGERIGTERMRKIGKRPGQKYTAEEVKLARLHIPVEFLLQDEISPSDAILIPESDYSNRRAQLEREASARPNSYPVADFFEACRRPAHELEDELKKLCLDPSESLECGPWWFHELIICLREYKAAWMAARVAATITTAIGAKVGEAIDYAMESRCLVLIDGPARIGKTFSAKARCEASPGRLRYVQVPSTNDEIGFMRAIAKSIGVSINLNSKAQELRQRIEETLQTGQLGIVFDEAHYLWPNLIDPRTIPARVNWILTALINHGVSVALVTTPQFLKAQKMVESRTRWTSEQFDGRLGHYEALPDTIAESDLEKVAGALLPEGDEKSIKILVRYAQSSSKYLAGIEHAIKRARYLARRDNRARVNREDIKRAIVESVIPSDSAFARAMEPSQPGSRRRAVKPSLMEPLPVINNRAEAPQPDLGRTRSAAPESIKLDTRRCDTPPLVPG